MVDSSAIQAYLKGIGRRYEQWRLDNALTSTIAVGQASFPLFEQFVQTEEKWQGKPPEKKTLPLLKGILDYLDKEHVLLVGSPGVGKSSTLWQCLNELAKKELEETKPRIPLLVQLKSFTKSDDPDGLLALIRTSFGLRFRVSIPEVEGLLRDKRLILLLDGLNEMPAGAFHTHLKTFRQECQDLEVPLICSTRELHGGNLGIQRKLEIQPLEHKEVERFLQECLPEHQDQVRQLLQRDNRDLSRTPFVLWMLYHLLKETGTIADTLGKAFHVFFHTDLRSYKEDISTERRENWNLWLGQLAFSMLKNPDPLDPGLVISRENAEKVLAENFDYEPFSNSLRVDELLKYSPLLTKVSENEICFQHQLVQEYYAAEHLLDKLEKEPHLLKTIPDKEYAPFQMYYLNYSKWTEVISLMLNMSDLSRDNSKKIKEILSAAFSIDLMLGTKLIGAVKASLREDLVVLFFKEIEENSLCKTFKFQLLGNTCSKHAALDLLDYLIKERDQERIFEIAFSLRINGVKSISDKLLEISEFDSNITTRLASIHALGKFGDIRASLKLQALYPNADPSTQVQILEALSEIDPQGTCPLIISALNSKKTIVREKAIEIAGDLRNESAFEKLLYLTIEDEVLLIRWSAAEAVRKIDPQQAVAKLSSILEDSKDTKTRTHIVEALGKIEHESAISILIDKIDDVAVSGEVAEALVSIGGNKAVPKLLEVLQRESWCSEQVVFVLGELGDPVAVPHLINVLGHWSKQVQEKSIEALGKLNDEEAIPKLYKLLEDNTENNFSTKEFRQKIAIALGKLGDKRVRSLLISALEKQAFGVYHQCFGRWQLFEALAKVSDDSVVKALIQSLKSDNYEVRCEAAKTLGEIGGDIAIESLIHALGDKKPAVCWKASEALGKFEVQKVLPRLSALLENPSRDIRSYATQTLGYLEDQSSVEMLLGMLEDPEEIVRYDAAQGLVKLSTSDLRLFVSKALTPCQMKSLYNDSLSYLVKNIQNNCGFYNYEVEIQAHELQMAESSDAELLARIYQVTQQINTRTKQMKSESKNDFRGAHFSAPVNFGNHCTGDLINTQNNYATDPEIQNAIFELNAFLAQLQIQHPYVTTKAEAFEVIDAELSEPKLSQNYRLATLRKQILDSERQLKAFKAALGEFAKHYLENSVWAKTIITYLDKLSEEPN